MDNDSLLLNVHPADSGIIDLGLWQVGNLSTESENSGTEVGRRKDLYTKNSATRCLQTSASVCMFRAYFCKCMHLRVDYSKCMHG